MLPGDFAVTPEDSLVFTLAHSKEKPRGKDKNKHDGDEKEEEGDTPKPIDLTLELKDADGGGGRLPLSHYATVQPQLTVQVRKSDLFNQTKKSEPVFQSFAFPLEDFTALGSGLDVSRLREIAFVFDRTPEGVVILDNVAFRPAVPPVERPQGEQVLAVSDTEHF